MYRPLLVPLAAFALVIACGDEPTKESPLPKAAPKTATAAKAAPVAPKVTDARALNRATKPSTVCLRYRGQLSAVRQQVQLAPASKPMQLKAANLEALAADACQ